MKTLKIGELKVFEQLGRISITTIAMLGIHNLELSVVGEWCSMISVLIWMLLPTLSAFRIVNTKEKEEKQKDEN